VGGVRESARVRGEGVEKNNRKQNARHLSPSEKIKEKENL